MSGYTDIMDPDPDHVWLAQLLEDVGAEGAHAIADWLGIDLDDDEE